MIAGAERSEATRTRPERAGRANSRLSAKLPRDVTGARFIRVAERVGFVVERHGKHIVLMRERDRKRVVVPVRGSKRIGAGLLRKLVREAGLTVEELVRLL